MEQKPDRISEEQLTAIAQSAREATAAEYCVVITTERDHEVPGRSHTQMGLSAREELDLMRVAYNMIVTANGILGHITGDKLSAKIVGPDGLVVDVSEAEEYRTVGIDKEQTAIERHEAAGRERAELLKNWDNEPSSSDAWKLMIYECEACKHKERIWNARPHVTPFAGVPCPQCDGSMSHAYFGSDEHTPDYRPVKGEMIFIDTPPELALIWAKRMIDLYAGREDMPEPPAAEKLALSNLADFGGHCPTAIRLLR